MTVQYNLDKVRGWTAEWRIKIRAEEASAVVFPKKIKLKLPEVKFKNAEIYCVISVC
jgi:hypothetical protein